jgi:hypothetical protein
MPKDCENTWPVSDRESSSNLMEINGGEEYATAIKALISFLRYGIKPRGISEATIELFRSLGESLYGEASYHHASS